MRSNSHSSEPCAGAFLGLLVFFLSSAVTAAAAADEAGPPLAAPLEEGFFTLRDVEEAGFCFLGDELVALFSVLLFPPPKPVPPAMLGQALLPDGLFPSPI